MSTHSIVHPLHEPGDRVLIATLGAWEVRQFAQTDRRLAYFARRGFAHVQLWHPCERVSIVTPSRITGGTFDLWSDDVRAAAPVWSALEPVLLSLGIAPPSRNEIRALERWFVLPMEATGGRLLRSWWAGEVAY